MKGRSTFHILLLLVVLLTFSSHTVFGIRSYPTKPEVERKQTPAVIQAKQDAKQDAEVDLNNIKDYVQPDRGRELQAIRDAEADLNNKLLWDGVGCAVSSLPALGYFVGSFGHQSYPFISIMSDQQCLGSCVGIVASTAATSGTLILIHNYQLTPPPERLIGKTPEYVAVYTDAYKKRTRRLRTERVRIGFIAGFVGGWIGAMTALEFLEQ